jgi:hypothetical protein
LTCGKATSWTCDTEPHDDNKCVCLKILGERVKKSDATLRYLNDIIEHARTAAGVPHVALLQRTLEHIEKVAKELLEMHRE